MSRRPLLRQVVDLDLLLCTGLDSENVVLFLCHIFTQRPTTDRNVERSDGRCFGRQQLLTYSIEIFISHEKKVTCCCPKFISRPDIYKALNPCWLLNWVSITRVVGWFPQASLPLPTPTAANLETPCVVLARLTRASRAGELFQELGHWFCPPNLQFRGTAFGEIARWPGGAQTWTQTWTLQADQRVVKVL